MGFLRRGFLLVTVAVQFAAFGFTLLVIGSGGLLGQAELISASDAMIVFVVTAAAATLTVLEVIVLWHGGRVRRRLAAEVSRRPPPWNGMTPPRPISRVHRRCHRRRLIAAMAPRARLTLNRPGIRPWSPA